MKLVKYFLSKKPVTILLLVLVLAGGLLAYVKMGKLEDAPFTIKQALVLTPYPGASPSEVQSQVTDVLEESIQALGELYYLKTENRAGLSKITVYVKKETRADEMQQLWDKLRRKVSDVQSKLPEGAGPSVVNDDFGDVLGVFYGLTGSGHSYRELEDEAKLIKNEILKVKDVAKVEIYGTQTPTIDISVSPSVMARSGITMADIARAFEAQNKVVDAGGIDVGSNRLRIESTGNFYSLDDIRNLTIVSRTGEHFRLADITRIEESYQTPASNLMRINGQPAVGIAISTVPTGNVVDMAAAVKESLQQMSGSMPEGFELVTLYDQGYESAVANQGFILNLIISVLTVVAILLFFIGFKNGLLIGSGLVFSIFATLIVMLCTDIALQRMSLAAIIIAMGMLVDNAIVVSDSALVNMQRGMRKRVAIMRACSSTALPLLAATIIAILTFLPIYFSPHITGANSVLHSGICTPSPAGRAEKHPVRRKVLQYVPPFPALGHQTSLCHNSLHGLTAGTLCMELQIHPQSIRTCTGQAIFYRRRMAARRFQHRRNREAGGRNGRIYPYTRGSGNGIYLHRQNPTPLLSVERSIRTSVQLYTTACEVPYFGRVAPAQRRIAGFYPPEISRTAHQSKQIRTEPADGSRYRSPLPGPRPGSARFARRAGHRNHAPQS